MPQLEAPRVLLVLPNMVLASWRGLFIEDFRRPVTAREVRAKYDAQQRFMQQARAKTPILSVIRDGAVGMMDSETRGAVAELSHSVDALSKAVALVLLVRGFGGSVVRSIIASAMLVRRVNYPAKVHDTVASACTWLAPQVGDEATAAELVEVVQRVHDVPTG